MLDTIRRSLKPSLQFIPFFFKTSWYWILSLHIFSFAMAEFFESMAALNQLDTKLIVLCAIGGILSILVYSLFLSLLLPIRWQEWKFSLPLRSFGFIIKKYTLPLVTEGLRVFVRVVLWLFAFVLPGLFQSYRLSLVPYIVLLNKDYDEGRLDALKHSHALIRGHDFGFILLFIALAFLDYSFELVGSIPGFPSSLSFQFIISLLTLPLSLYSYAVLVEVYNSLEQKFRGEHSNGSNI